MFKKCNNEGIVPLVSMATETRELKTCLEKATPKFHRLM